MVKENVLKFIKENILERGEEESFLVLDIDDIKRKLDVWKQCLPRVEPFYAVKCNDHDDIVSAMASWGLSFDCASIGEITKVMKYGVDPSKIIYANPCKQANHLKGAFERGVKMMTFDNQDELKKIKANCPNAIVVLRLATDDSKSVCRLSQKFGTSLDKVEFLLNKAKDLGLEFGGFSYHVGSGCESEESFVEAVHNARKAFDIAENMGFTPKVLDIGGGFSGNIIHQHDIDRSFDQLSEESKAMNMQEADNEALGNHGKAKNFVTIAKMIRKALDMYFPEGSGYRIIAEPGRYFVHSCGTLCVNIIARRLPEDFKTKSNETDYEQGIMYYVNEGVYGSFSNTIYDHAVVSPNVLVLTEKEVETPKKLFKSSLWGPSCDGLDCIIKSTPLPKLKVGSWLYFEDMGAYTICAGSNFNGFKKTSVYSIRSDSN